MTLELQNLILEMIARGDPLRATIERLCLEAEALVPGTVCSVLSLEGGRLYALAGPSLPQAYCKELHNLSIGPLRGSCGTAAFHGEPVAVTDIEHDPR
ncbi:hypothetical protein [Affinirhizobium pseudoryzae]|uniref:hypothetical protein n=1 Tax=Allorhizobium pseudoryzae TaxID=379684 RepID=UPI001F28F4E7